jgi:hypothetical protein
MHNSGKRLGVAMATVVVVLGLNAFAVLSGVATGAYGLVFAHQSSDYLAATRADTAAPQPGASAAQCAQSDPKQLYPLSLAAGGIGGNVSTVPITRMC